MKRRMDMTVTDHRTKELEEELRQMSETLYWYPNIRAAVARRMAKELPNTAPMYFDLGIIKAAIDLEEQA